MSIGADGQWQRPGQAATTSYISVDGDFLSGEKLIDSEFLFQWAPNADDSPNLIGLWAIVNLPSVGGLWDPVDGLNWHGPSFRAVNDHGLKNRSLGVGEAMRQLYALRVPFQIGYQMLASSDTPPQCFGAMLKQRWETL